MSQNNRIKKPKSHNLKSSDRRLASGVRPEAYLLSEQRNTLSNIESSVFQKKVTNNNSKESINATNDSSVLRKSSANNKKNRKNIKDKKDLTLEEWNPKHFRLFVGNLGSDGNDALLLKVFGKYESLTKVKVPMTNGGENKGYGFVAFESPNDYLQAFKELNGKYIGHNPCVLKKANDLKK
ncbi:hypothetical protein WICMUC_002900 [Wickerhamomyces mucosus]|uniref:RRM domain-containing protein n=1 Tax=Wickerhamomyces mucosus TaxID=1378264 RepID=A0A9P8PMW8_9ASCO|nr:hypothetical protein WICMUC_002900 [Wickerhamomyces mucosus]